jgi:hypothetical protein
MKILSKLFSGFQKEIQFGKNNGWVLFGVSFRQVFMSSIDLIFFYAQVQHPVSDRKLLKWQKTRNKILGDEEK